MNSIFKNQFIDIIEYIDPSDKLIVSKYYRPNNEIKEGAQLIVRESQCAIFVCQGQIADIFGPGTYKLKTGNLPILSTLEAFSFGFRSPIRSDLYFVSLKQFTNNKWATKRPLIKRDKEFNMVRLRAFGKFSFAITDVRQFMKEIFGTQQLVYSYDIVQYLSSIVSEAFAIVVGELNVPVLDLTSHYQDYSAGVLSAANEKVNALGLTFTDIVIESISLPEEVEHMIDEQSGMGMAGRDLNQYIQYQTVQAMRDAAKQEGGLAGLGASAAIGNTIASSLPRPDAAAEGTNPVDEIRKYKSLLDDGIITQEEFNKKKQELLGL